MRVKFRFSRLKIFEANETQTRTPDGVKIMVSSDGKAWNEAKHTGIKGVFKKTISKSVERIHSRYAFFGEGYGNHVYSSGVH